MAEPKKQLTPLTTLKGINSAAHRPAPPPEDDEVHELLGRALARLSHGLEDDEQAKTLLTNELQNASIPTWLYSPKIGFVPVVKGFWPCTPGELERRLTTSRAGMLGSSKSWVFIAATRCAALILRHKRWQSAPYVFDLKRSRWPLHDALVWIGAKGQDTTTGDIRQKSLAERGAAVLFEALSDQPALGGVYVYGLGQHIQTRMQLSPGDWDAAHLDDDSRDYGCVVYLKPRIDGVTGDEHAAADFHKSKTAGAWIRDLWIKREELFSLFPQFCHGPDTPEVQMTSTASRPKTGRGGKKGQGAKDDSAQLQSVEAKVQSGIAEFKACEEVAAEFLPRTATSTEIATVQKRLYRKRSEGKTA